MRRIRREMASVYADAREGRISTSDATRLVYILTSIARVVEGPDLDTRVAEIERKLQQAHPQQLPASEPVYDPEDDA